MCQRYGNYGCNVSSYLDEHHRCRDSLFFKELELMDRNNGLKYKS